MKRLLILLLIAMIVPWQLAVATHAQTGAVISVSPLSVQPAGTLTIQGSGFVPRFQYTLSINTPSPVAATVTADANGQFITSVTIPGSTPPGAYSVSASNGAQTTFQVSAVQLYLSANPVPAGTSVTVNGSAFAPGSTVTVHTTVTVTGGTTQSVDATVSVSSSGTFSANLAIPGNSVGGTYTVSVYQVGTTTSIAQVSLTVTSPTAIALNPSSVSGGTDTAIGVTGTQFGQNEYVLVSYTANLNTGSTVAEQVTAQTDASGNFAVYTLPVPAAIVAGTYTVTATGQSSGRVGTATLLVTTQPSLSVNPTTAPPGTTVTVSGSHFAKNTPVTISAQFPLTGATSTPTPVSPSVTTDNSGNFSLQIAIPAGAQAGVVTVTASQGFNNTKLTATTTITVGALTPTIQVSPTVSAPGSGVTVSGHGFLPGPNAPVTVTVPFIVNGATQSVKQSVDADTTGSFSTSLTVPANALAGASTVTATQASSGATASGTLTVTGRVVTATPALTSTPTPSPTPTNTPVVSLVQPTPKPAIPPLRFRAVSLQHAAVRLLASNRVDARVNRAKKLTIQVTIAFPSGASRQYRGRTSAGGTWSKVFTVPANATSVYSNRAYAMLQVWDGKASAKTFQSFRIMP